MMKYVRMKGFDDNDDWIVIFPKNINHDCIAEVLGRMKNQTHGNWERVFREPVSAGFVDSAGTCHGESESLGLKSLFEDTEILAKQG